MPLVERGANGSRSVTPPSITVSDYSHIPFKSRHQSRRSTFGFYTGPAYDQLEPNFPIAIPIKEPYHWSYWQIAALSLVGLAVVLYAASRGYSSRQEHYHYVHRNDSNVDVFKTWWLEEQGIKAGFIGLGATLTNLYVKNRAGEWTDVVLGYDDRTQYLEDPSFAYFGSVVGRYANRIKNATFSIPPTRLLPPDARAGPLPPNTRVFHTTPNEHYGLNTLHGGKWGYSRAGWSLVRYEPRKGEIEFGLMDRDGTEGFPGEVYTTVTYTLSTSPKTSNPILTTSMHATVSAGHETPIMLSSHVYFNLDGYRMPSSAGGKVDMMPDAAKRHKLSMLSSEWIKVDGILVPTGEIGSLDSGEGGNLTTSGKEALAAMDFRSERTIGERWEGAKDACGPGCTGYDTAFVLDSSRSLRTDPAAVLSSPSSGIRMALRTTLSTMQLYTCTGLNSLIPRKASHGGPALGYGPKSCVVLEPEGRIGGLREIGWGEDQMYDEHRPYDWWSEYEFSVDPR